jgi:uncharacterized membrane protein (DUF106 family)
MFKLKHFFLVVTLIALILPLIIAIKYQVTRWERIKKEKEIEFIKCAEKKYKVKHIAKNTFVDIRTNRAELIYFCP